MASGQQLQINNFDANSAHITGSGGITVTGGGVLTVSSTLNSAYTGNWTVSAGTLEAQQQGSQSLGSGTVRVASGAELRDAWGQTVSNTVNSNVNDKL